MAEQTAPKKPEEQKKSFIGRFVEGYANLARTVFSGLSPAPSVKKTSTKPAQGGKPAKKQESGLLGGLFGGNNQPEKIYDHSKFHENALKLTLEFYDEDGNQYDVKESFPKDGTKVRIDEPTGNYIVIRFTQVKIEEKSIPLG